jgi:hypothetical protein
MACRMVEMIHILLSLHPTYIKVKKFREMRTMPSQSSGTVDVQMNSVFYIYSNSTNLSRFLYSYIALVKAVPPSNNPDSQRRELTEDHRFR